MLFEPLDAILGTRSKLRLLRALVPLDRSVSGREAARLAGISHYGISALDELAALGIIRRREASGQHLFSFNREHVLASSVTGEAGPASDLDVLVLVEDLADGDAVHSALVDAAADLEIEFGVRLSPVTLTVRQGRRQLREGDPFMRRVLEEGRRICGRPLGDVLDG